MSAGRKKNSTGIKHGSSSNLSLLRSQQSSRTKTSTTSDLSLTQQEEQNDVGWAKSPEREIEFKRDVDEEDSTLATKETIVFKKPKILQNNRHNPVSSSSSHPRASEKFLALMDCIDVVDEDYSHSSAPDTTSSSDITSEFGLSHNTVTAVNATSTAINCNVSAISCDLNSSVEVRDTSMNDSLNSIDEVGIFSEEELRALVQPSTGISPLIMTPPEVPALVAPVASQFDPQNIPGFTEVQAPMEQVEDEFPEISEEEMRMLDELEKSRHIASTPSTSSSHVQPIVCMRFVALDVMTHVDSRRKEIRCFRSETLSENCNDTIGSIFTVVIAGDWYDSPIASGDIFHVLFLGSSGVSEYDPSVTTIDVTDTCNLFVVHPDVLVSPSKLSEAISCARRGVLNERSKLMGSSRAALLGNIKHEFIEKFLDLSIENIKMLESFEATQIPEFILSTEEIINLISKVKLGFLQDMHHMGISDDEVTMQLRGIVPGIVRWVHEITPGCLEACHRKIHGAAAAVKYTQGNKQASHCVDEVSGIEENICCPALGLKGQIDIIASVRNFKSSKTYNIPIEVKTGIWRPSTSISHRAQTIMYVLMVMLRDKEYSAFPLHDFLDSTSAQPIKDTIAIRNGLLVYIADEGVRCEVVDPTWTEIRNLVGCRNKLASNLSFAAQVVARPYPAMLRHSDCERCYTAAECMLNHAALENGNKSSSGVPTLFSYVIRNLSPLHLKYFQHWTWLLDLETAASSSDSSFLWTASGQAFENSSSKCICDLYMAACNVADGFSICVFKKCTTNSLIPARFSPGDRVTLSIENRNTAVDIEDIADNRVVHWGVDNVEPIVCTGSVVSVSSTELHVQFRKIPRRIMCLIGKNNSNSCFRIDKDESTIGVGTMRANLVRLFVSPFDPKVFQDRKMLAEKEKKANGVQDDIVDTMDYVEGRGSARVRRLVVDLLAPSFSVKERPSTTLAVYKGCEPKSLQSSLASLNREQQHAVHRIAAANDYVLLLGMPGTGKSSTLSFAIRYLVSKGNRVLITSYTHSAVDTLVSKLKDAGMDCILRIGAKTSVKESIHDFVLDTSILASVDELKKRIDQSRVVACTCLAASSDGLLSDIEFDYCIVDEAGQITQPATLGALMLSKRFVLVGDDYQLPPLVLSTEALVNGMDISLFKRLAEAHPDAVVTLTNQYRMNAEIMEVSNTLVYNQRLTCGSADVACARLCLRTPISADVPSWLGRCLSPEQPVVFLSTDGLRTPDKSRELESYVGGKEGRSSRGTVVNTYEADCVKRICDAFLRCGIEKHNIGVVSPYRSQVQFILRYNIEKGVCVIDGDAVEGCDISTVDKFQGRDMDVLVISLVRSNAQGSVGTLLRDWRRVNVALTRAKYKLIIIGSLSTMENIPILNALVDLGRRKAYIVELQEGDVLPSAVSMEG